MTVNNGYQFDEGVELLTTDYEVQKVVDAPDGKSWLTPVYVTFADGTHIDATTTYKDYGGPAQSAVTTINNPASLTSEQDEDRFTKYEKLIDEWTEWIVRAMPCGSEDFVRLVMSLVKMHARKSHDYGTAEDPFANIRESGYNLGPALLSYYGVTSNTKDVNWDDCTDLPPWLGARLRQRDKDFRINRWLESTVLANEGPKDAFLDKASYTIIEWIMHCQEHGLDPLTGK